MVPTKTALFYMKKVSHSDRAQGAGWELLMSVPLFCPTVPSCRQSKLEQEAAVRGAGQCLNSWF